MTMMITAQNDRPLLAMIVTSWRRVSKKPDKDKLFQGIKGQLILLPFYYMQCQLYKFGKGKNC